jgi:hypothetical protein
MELEFHERYQYQSTDLHSAGLNPKYPVQIIRFIVLSTVKYIWKKSKSNEN